MRTMIHEIGMIDKQQHKHAVRFNKGLNVVTGKSSTGKSALIEIFDYCFGSSENTIPQGIITDNADIYYVALAVKDQEIVIARQSDTSTKAFFRLLETYNTDNITANFFTFKNYFIDLKTFKKHLTSLFMDISDIDESLEARYAKGQRTAIPSIRSFSSFMLQHQNLIANKHALFYRFDEKAKRDQVIKNVQLFLKIVDQKYFNLKQQQEELENQIKYLKRQQEANKRLANKHGQKIQFALTYLYSLMGFKHEPLSLADILHNPEEAKNQLDNIIVLKKIDDYSDANIEYYYELKKKYDEIFGSFKTLQRKAKLLEKHIEQSKQFISNIRHIPLLESAYISASVCPFCHTEQKRLQENAEKLGKIIKNLQQRFDTVSHQKAPFETQLAQTQQKMNEHEQKLIELTQQIKIIEEAQPLLIFEKNRYENILMQKAILFSMLDILNLANGQEFDEQIKQLNAEKQKIDNQLKPYEESKKLNNAAKIINQYMAEIGNHFEFEASYKPINLHFDLETFDLYHQSTKSSNKKIYIRSMGSGANWLYSHITLFLALHKYFAQLNDDCAIPSILFLDQPTQVYFPNFQRDQASSFQEQSDLEEEQRKNLDERSVDEDIKAVENLFSQLAIYCQEMEENNGFSPQIIVTDHADGLNLSNGFSFDDLVNGNRWRTRGFIDPIPQ